MTPSNHTARPGKFAKVTLWDKLSCELMYDAVQSRFPNLVTVHDESALLREAPDSTVVLMRGLEYTANTAAMLSSHGNQVRWIQLLSSGYDRLTEHGTPPGLIVTNSRGIYSTSVAQHAIMLMLGATRCLPRMLELQREHRWDKTMRDTVRPIEGGTLVVLGYGSLGQEIGRLGKALGMHIIGIKRSVGLEPHADEVIGIGQLHAALPRADVMIIALPGSPETARMIGAAQLALLPAHSVVVNVGRGNVIDTDALCRALHDGVIAGAGLDVTDPEPLPAECPLWDCPNLIITPHVGGRSGPATARRFADFVGDNLSRYLAGTPLLNPVTP
jgi:phosphoglycerate dehydrogenase-like enzyme